MTLALHVNLAVRFLLELALLGAVGTVTWDAVGSPVLRPVATVAVVVGLAAAWALLVHGARVPSWGRAGAQVAALALGTLALLHLGAPRLAALVAGAAVVNAALLAAWQQ